MFGKSHPVNVVAFFLSCLIVLTTSLPSNTSFQSARAENHDHTSGFSFNQCVRVGFPQAEFDNSLPLNAGFSSDVQVAPPDWERQADLLERRLNETADFRSDFALSVVRLCAKAMAAHDLFSISERLQGQPERVQARLRNFVDPARQALILDLETSSGGKARIEAAALLRVITLKSLLPIGLTNLIVRNIDVVDALQIHSRQIGHSITFEDAIFRGGRTRQLGHVSNEDQRNNPAYAVTVFASTINGNLSFIDSILCSHVVIRTSTIANDLAFNRVNVGPMINPSSEAQPQVCRAEAQSANTKSAILHANIRIETSNIGSRVYLRRSYFNSFRVSGSTISNLTMTDTSVERFEMTGSDLNSIDIGDFCIGNLQLEANRIAGDVSWIDSGSAVCPVQVIQGEKIVFKSNKTGGGLIFVPVTSHGGTNGGQATQSQPKSSNNRLDFQNNDFLSSSIVAIDRDWTGTLDLSNSRFDNKLSFAHCSTITDCDEIGAEESSVPPGLIHINLDGTTIDWLEWAFPLAKIDQTQRHVSWTAKNLSINNWSFGAGPNTEFVLDKRRWLSHLGNIQGQSFIPGPFMLVGDKLIERGSRLNGRQMHCQAHAIGLIDFQGHEALMRACGDPIDVFAYIVTNFEHWSAKILEISWDLVRFFGNALIALPETLGLTDAMDDTTINDYGVMERLWKAFVVFFLLPSGFGALPENCLFYILILTGLGFTIYKGHSWRCARRLHGSKHQRRVSNDVIQELRAMLKAQLSSESSEALKCEILGWREKLLELDRLRRLEPKSPALDTGELEDFMTDLIDWWKNAGLPNLDDVVELAQRLPIVSPANAGSSKVPGFSRFSKDHAPTRFSVFRYAIDTSLPVIDLHGYSAYYPEHKIIRTITHVHHVIAWYLWTVLIASITII